MTCKHNLRLLAVGISSVSVFFFFFFFLKNQHHSLITIWGVFVYTWYLIMRYTFQLPTKPEVLTWSIRVVLKVNLVICPFVWVSIACTGPTCCTSRAKEAITFPL